MKKFSLEEKNISGMKNSYIYDIKKNSGEEDNSSNPPNLQKSTENLSKIADKDKWLKEVKGEESISEDELLDIFSNKMFTDYYNNLLFGNCEFP